MHPWIVALALTLAPGCPLAEKAIATRVTLFGYADNDPPGTAIAHPVVHQHASGAGTYADPITFAANAKQFAPGTRIYVPYLQKYFIMEDDCATAIKTANAATPLVDLWAGGTASSDVRELLNTESYFTRSLAQVIIDPAPNHPVNVAPIFADRSTPNKQFWSRAAIRPNSQGRDREASTEPSAVLRIFPALKSLNVGWR